MATTTATWEKASDRGSPGGIHFDSASRHLSGPQFGGNAALKGLHANLSKSGYANGPLSHTSNPMEGYRNNLRQLSLSSATSSQHSLGAALNANHGSMYDVSVSSSSSSSAIPVAPSRKKATKTMATAPAGGKRKSRTKAAGSALKLRASKHAGKLAATLRSVAGA